MRLDRLAQKMLAASCGYFWIPCPVCREPFGGHEWRDVDGLPSIVPDPGTRHLHLGICPDCTRAGFGYPHGWDRP